MALPPSDAPVETSNVADAPANNPLGRTENFLTPGAGFDSAAALRDLFNNVGNRDSIGQINDIFKSFRTAPSAVMGAFPLAGDLLAGLGVTDGLNQTPGKEIQLAQVSGGPRNDAGGDIRLAQLGDRRNAGDRQFAPALSANFIKEVKDAYGVDISARQGKYNLSYRADGKTHSIPLDLPLSPDSLPKIKESLERITQERIKSIESRFGITIKPPGQFVGNQEDLCRVKPGEKPVENPNDPNAIRSRQPSLPELFALENALTATGPSQRTTNGRPLEVIFADRAPLKDRRGESQQHLASYVHPDGANDNARLFIYPSAAKTPPTDRDTGRPEGSLAYTIRHEIGHNQQHNAFPDGKLPEHVLNQLGFIQFSNPRYPAHGQEPYNHAVETRDGRFFARGEPNCNDAAGNWYQVDRDGNPLGRDGKKVSDPSQAVKVSDEAMDRLSKRKYPTGYYDSPLEVLSEGFAAYTGSARDRESLRTRYPHVYNAIQATELAQREALERRR